MNTNNLIKTVLSLVVLAVILLGAYFVISLRGNNAEENNTNDTKVTDNTNQKSESKNSNSDLPLAHEFELTDLDGNRVKLSDYRGKIVFVNFWATWCPPCINEMPDFNEVNKVFEQNGDAVLLAVNLTTGGVRGETEDKVRKFINNNGYTMKVLLDKTGKVADQYKIFSIPTTYIVDKDGKIYDYYEHMLSKDMLMSIYNTLRE